VSLSYWNIGYGYDVLLGRFLYWGGPGNGWNYPNGTPNGIMPYEPWYDNMSLRVDIHENCANVSMCAVMAYDWRAWTSEVAPAGTATWIWAPCLTDCVFSAVGGLSELDIYLPYRNESDPGWTLLDPGSSTYGKTSKYDAPPVAVTLEPGESIIILAPRTLTVGYLPMAMIGDDKDGSSFVGGYYNFLKVLEVFGNATIHPVGCWPDTCSLDKEMGDLTMVGPFVPIIKYHPQITWLVYEPAPRIELWIQ
jgi:hypothetical protein